MIARQSPRRGLSLLAGVGCVIAFSCVAFAQATDSLRTWTDSSGRYKREAAFVRVEADSIYLKLADGRVISLPLARLSDADRDHLAKLSAGDAPAARLDAGVLSQLRAASVVVWQQHGDQAAPMPGIVVHKEGDRAFVVLKGGISNRAFRTRTPGPFFVAADDAAALRLPAEWRGECANGTMTVLVAPAAEMPDPLPLASAAEPVCGRTVTLIGRQIKSGSPPTATAVQESATVHRVFRAIDGTVASIRIQTPPAAPAFGLVANDEGQFLGVMVREDRPPTVRDSRHKPGPPPFYSVEPGTAFLARMTQPYRVSMAAKKSGSDAGTWQFVAHVADPFDRTRNPRLRIRFRTDINDKQPPCDENDPGAMLTDIEQLPFVQQQPDVNSTGVPPNDVQNAGLTTLVADYTPNDREISPAGLFIQFVYETPDGKTHVDPPAAMTLSSR